MKSPQAQVEAISFAARWTSRIALFSAGVVVAGLIAHRLVSMPTPVALNLIKLSMLGAVCSLVLGAMAVVVIWRRGTPGVARIVLGALVSVTILAWPLGQYTAFTDLPELNDITTDTKNPPPFIELARLRPSDANTTKYRAKDFSGAQRTAYPDLVGLNVNRSSVSAFEAVVEAVKRAGLTIVREQVPDDTGGQPGMIEAFDRTLVLGFYDDVAVRVSGDVLSARIDIRSASRYGRHDLGQNAKRVRALLKEIVNRLEASVSVPSARQAPVQVQPKKKTSRRKKRRRRSRRRR